MPGSFQFAATPQLHFGEGKFSGTVPIISSYGNRVLIILGSKSFRESGHYTAFTEKLENSHLQYEQYAVETEPTPSHIDSAVQRFRSFNPHVVIAIGGGSVLDAGKAISAMLVSGKPVTPYLEGVGTKLHDGKKIPFIAVPTTSGTGSEATKNAVLSQIGEKGFKRSLRHAHFVPDHAVVDPVLTLSCSSATTASSGMDAFTQLLESYVSTSSNSLTDSLAVNGLKHISTGLVSSYQDGTNLRARSDMSYAAYLSGVTLANAGLGLVHGFASSIGGIYGIPHGVICSALMYGANSVTVRKLRKHHGESVALSKYSRVGKIFSSKEGKTKDYYIDFLLDYISSIAIEMKIPRLEAAGVERNKMPTIIQATDNKNNPLPLDKDEIMEVLESAM